MYLSTFLETTVNSGIISSAQKRFGFCFVLCFILFLLCSTCVWAMSVGSGLVYASSWFLCCYSKKKIITKQSTDPVWKYFLRVCCILHKQTPSAAITTRISLLFFSYILCLVLFILRFSSIFYLFFYFLLYFVSIGECCDNGAMQSERACQSKPR